MTNSDNLVEAQINPNVLGLPPSATVAINDRCNELRRQGREIFKLGLGQSPFPVPDPVIEALRRHAAEKDYLPVQGLRGLREAVAEHHRRTFGIDCSPDDVLIGPGSKELMFLLQLVYDGELVIPTPCWVSYAPQAKIIGRAVCQIPTSFDDNWLLTPDLLDCYCDREQDRARLLILNYPSNPSGMTFSKERLASLATVARKRRMLVLSDEIYGKLHHDGGHNSIVPLLPERTIFSGGLSKWCGAGGWRLGLFVFPKSLSWLREAMAAVATETFTSTSAPIQYAAIRAFQGGQEIEEYLEQSRRVLRAVASRLTQLLKEAGARIRDPQGGFYLFPDFTLLQDRLHRRGIQTSALLCERLLEETGVAILPGVDFGRPAEELTARLAYVDFDGSAALEGARRIPRGQELDGRFVDRHCRSVVEAVRRLCEWLVDSG